MESGTKVKFNCSFAYAIFILLAIGLYPCFFNPKPVPLKKNLDEVLLTIGDWRSKSMEYDQPWAFRIQEADVEFTRTYQSISGREVSLYIGYFELQQQGKELLNYLTNRLQGNSGEIEIPLGEDRYIRINKTMLKDGKTNRLILFWYDLDGKIITNLYRVPFTTLLNAITKGRKNGAIIMVSPNTDYLSDSQEIIQEQKLFIQSLIKILKDYLPS